MGVTGVLEVKVVVMEKMEEVVILVERGRSEVEVLLLVMEMGMVVKRLPEFSAEWSLE